MFTVTTWSGVLKFKNTGWYLFRWVYLLWSAATLTSGKTSCIQHAIVNPSYINHCIQLLNKQTQFWWFPTRPWTSHYIWIYFTMSIFRVKSNNYLKKIYIVSDFFSPDFAASSGLAQTTRWPSCSVLEDETTKIVWPYRIIFHRLVELQIVTFGEFDLQVTTLFPSSSNRAKLSVEAKLTVDLKTSEKHH